MRCEDARTLLLEADVAELDPDGSSPPSSPLAAHLRDCARCAAAAADIRRSLAELDAHLTAAAPDGAVDAIMARLAEPVAAAAGGSAPARAIAGGFFPAGRTWRRSPWIPFALAAGVAGLFYVARVRTPLPEGGTALLASAPALPLVESSGSAGVAVIETDNPDITVLWFF